jgi:hypothetical protein
MRRKWIARMTSFAWAAGLVLAWGCGTSGGGNLDVVDTPELEGTPDPTEEDLPVEPPEEEIPAEPLRACVIPCSVETECCLTAACGTYPDLWTCSGVCELAGCSGNGECIDWATRRGFPSPETYTCRAYAGGVPRCVSSCSIAQDCCPSEDCSSYPTRRVCDGGGCFLGGCIDDTECRTWAAGNALFMADSYVCRQPLGSGLSVCAQSCVAADDCCPPEKAPCTTLPSHFACSGGICTLNCSTDEECRQFATAAGYPLADRYVCRDI